ncbi:MAG: diaminopimelate epimerase [Bacteroidetes bacterium]|jgi:diaminopimelate epimerase|nr:diaminopimelate epimerase [Bacteroidota bacterium]
MKILFEKLHGAGNDFIVIDNRRRIVRNASRLAKRLCDRHLSIGADGLLLVEHSARADYRMMYYNADGSYGGMCGNGGRSIALFAYVNGIADRVHRFSALGHIYQVSVGANGRVSLSMKDPLAVKSGLKLRGPLGNFLATFVDTGSPHVVIKVQKGTLRGLDLKTLGPWIRHHRAFSPHGANVNFMEVLGPKLLQMRTYERGVEAETLACGTGSVACSIIASQLFGVRSPVTIVASSGDRLRVSFRESPEGYREVILDGPARRAFKGTIDV